MYLYLFTNKQVPVREYKWFDLFIPTRLDFNGLITALSSDDVCRLNEVVSP